MCGSMVYIQSATAENRRGNRQKIEEETTGQKYNGLPYSIGGIMKTQICMEKALYSVDISPTGLNRISSERTAVDFQRAYTPWPLAYHFCVVIKVYALS